MAKNALVQTFADIFYNGLEYFNRFYGEYRGFVVDRDDPKKEGRVRLVVPGIIDEPMEDWVSSVDTFSGHNFGFKLIPPVGTLVWVTFENGDPNKPLWKQGYFGEGEIPNDLSDPDQYWLLTPNGHLLEFNDTGDNYIRVRHNSGSVVELNDNGVSLESHKIFLGTTDDADEPAVLGDTIVDLLNEFITDVGNIGNISTSSGVTFPIRTSPQWASLESKWRSKWREVQSNKVKLDK